MTGGSYRYIRHPNLQRNAAGHLRIGSRRRPGLPGGFVGMAIYCVYSARTEEGLMMQAFPEQYTRYKRRTKAFIPFVV